MKVNTLVKKRVLKISDLVFDAELYPRMKTSWLTVYGYAQSMRAGGVFPPIVIGLWKGKKYVVDGWHRAEAKKKLKEKYVSAIVKPFKTFREMFVESVKLNITHGRQLNIQERVRIIDKLEQYKFTLVEIKDITMMPITSIQRLKPRIVRRPDGSVIYLKGITERAAKKSGGKAEDADQRIFSVWDVQKLLKQLIELLKHDLYPFDEVDVKELTVQLYWLLEKYVDLAKK